MVQTIVDRDPLVEIVVNRIVKAAHPQKIVLFGSRARGNGEPDSDIDLLIVYDGAASKQELKQQIRNLFPDQDFSMDLFVLSPEEFEWQKGVVSTVGRAAHLEGVVYYEL